VDLLTSARVKPSRLIVGLMSGTSADGIDACLCRIKGFGIQTAAEIEHFSSLKYPETLKHMITSDLNNLGLEDIARLNFFLGNLLAQAALKCIEEAGYAIWEIDAISSHGQTLIHLPDCHHRVLPIPATLQIGDISVIAQLTGILTIGDFRPADMAQGGQGAPLVPYADFVMFRHDDLGKIVQNIGGISNLTYLPPSCSLDDVIAFDTGPGNMVIDATINLLTKGNLSMDTDGEIANSGTVNREFLSHLLSSDYFYKPPPKSTGRELFGIQYTQRIIGEYKEFIQKQGVVWDIKEHFKDIVATVSELTVQTIVYSYKTWVAPRGPIDQVILGGGGAYNLYLVRRLKEELESMDPNIQVLTHEDIGIPNTAKEALAFCILGNEVIGLKPNNVPSATGAQKPVILGKVAFP